MISDEQYQYVQEHGNLPGGSSVSNSPVAAADQGDWNQLAKEEVISSEELAAMLFDGDIPGLTKEEEQAFKVLAPIYQPKRAKRLTYEQRRKHSRVELIRLSHRLRKEREALEERARLLEIPLIIEEGALIHIDEEGNPFYSRPLGMESCDSISADEVWPTNALGVINTNFNLTGAGITLAAWEFHGVNETHAELAGRVTDNTKQFSNKHPNAVASIMIGGGVTNHAHGVAYEASLHVHSWKDGALDDLTDVANEGLIRFSNHSYWTTYSFYGQYTTADKGRDKIVYLAYYHLPVWAIGNERLDVTYDYDTMNAGSAKNVLSVGAVNDLDGGYTNAACVETTYYSSWGPAEHGRIKPDLVASGYAGWVPSWGNDTDYYKERNSTTEGTSFAAPAVTGSLGLLQELHERLSGTNGIPLQASTYKALAIHTADEAGNAPGPDYTFGWGLMNAHSAAQLMHDNAQWNSNPFIKEVMLPDGEYISFSVKADTNLPLRVTICWTDPPGEYLVNDIDLRIIDPSNQTNSPWVLDWRATPIDHRSDPAQTGDNAVDNVEQVFVTNTVEGTYTVLINHKGTLVNEKEEPDGQELSIVLSGLLPENIQPDIAFSITNGFPHVTIIDNIGSVYKISRSGNLCYHPWQPVSNSTMAVLREEIEWEDPQGSTDSIKFYKIEPTE